jgi:hypothetical protein
VVMLRLESHHRPCCHAAGARRRVRARLVGASPAKRAGPVRSLRAAANDFFHGVDAYEPHRRDEHGDGLMMLSEEASDRRTATRIVEAIGDAGVTVAASRIGPNAEGGWELAAIDHFTGERWSVTSDTALAAAVELAQQLGFDLEE